MKKALFVTYGGGHVAMVIPVLRELQGRGGWDITTLALTTAGPALNRAGFPCIGFRDLVLPEDAEALQKGERLLDANHTGGLSIPREESVAYLGLSYADLERRVGVADAADRYAREGRRAFLPMGPMERLIRRLTPDLVVTTNSPRAEEAAIRAASRLGVPTLCVVDLLFPEGVYKDTLNAFLVEPGYGRRLAVFSEQFRRWLIDHGRRAEDVVATGNPAFDELADPALDSRAAALRRERGWEGRKVILWASQPEPRRPDLPGKILAALLEILPGHPDWYLVHRKHPSEPVGTTPLGAQAGRSDQRDDLALMLSAVDLVVTMTSTVGIQGVVRDKPLVKIRLSQFDETMPYESIGVALAVDRLEDLEGRLISALGGGPEAQAMREARRRLPRPGTATRAVVDVLESLAR